jgi:signal transduction histidine kinase/CheY-like chemotaxis protein/HPt (histidine-containing phosphotransfer) domain-containing protein
MPTDDQLRAIRSCCTDEAAYARLLHLLNELEPTSPPPDPVDARYHTLLTVLPAAVLHLDRNGTYLHVHAPEDFLLRPTSDMLQKTIYDILSVECADNIMAQLQQTLDSGEFRAFDCTITTIEGVIREREVRMMRLNDDEVLIGVIDVTAERQAVHALQQAHEAAAAADRARNAFLRNISHEIRTPLNTMLGMAGLLLDTDLSLEQRECVDMIRIAGNGLRVLIEDILDFSKIESGRLQLEHQPFVLRECIEDALDLVTADAAKKQLDLAYFVEDNVPDVVWGDAFRLRQVLVNLLANAVKFTERGEVMLTVACEPLLAAEGEPPRCAMQISVRDTGIGIAPELYPRLFQVFRQLDASMKRTYGGAGLGLAISKQLVELMGGSIDVESEPGVGSTFRVKLVAEAADEATKPFPRGRQAALADQPVLLIGPGSACCQSIARRLDVWGMHVTMAADIEEALALLTAGQTFVAVLVYTRRAAIPLLSRLTQQALPLVILPPIGMRHEVEQQMQGHAVAVVRRPARPLLLYRILTDLVAGKPIVGEPVARAQPAGDTPMAQHHPLRILIAEDNPVNIRAALLFLERLGYRADTATNGVEVLALLRAVRPQPYDVILMDVQMPELDGIETTRRIRAEWPADEQPAIIALTAHTQQETRAAYMAAGMNGNIDKSVRLDELAAALQQCQPLALRGAAPPAMVEPLSPATAPAYAPESTASSIDLQTLDQLGTRLGTQTSGKLSELIGVFLQHTEAFFEPLERAAVQHDRETLLYIAHTLKSSSANLGAVRLSQLCRALEEACHAQNTPLATERARLVADELRQVHIDLLALQRT